ncbi:MAG: hypothetical protein Q8M07_32730, partial [Prosthecobacter sp.]|nr:hypothetical protein [Prosthecobacter sp.]
LDEVARLERRLEAARDDLRRSRLSNGVGGQIPSAPTLLDRAAKARRFFHELFSFWGAFFQIGRRQRPATEKGAMMAKIGSLNVRLGADNTPLRDDLRMARRSVRSFSKDATRTMKRNPLFGGLKGMGRGIMGKLNPITAGIGAATQALKKIGVVGAASGAAVAYGLHRGMAAVDELSDSSKKLLGNDGSTGLMAGLKLAAKDAGVEFGTLSTGVSKALETISKAARGDKGAAGMLGAIGLDAKSLAAARPEQRIMGIVDALGKVRDVGDQIKLSRGIFGKAGGELVPLFRDGSNAIRDATAETQYFGQALNAVDAEKVGMAGDAVHRVGEAFKGVLMQSAVKFAPFIEDAASKLVGLIGGVNGVGAAV